MPDVSYPRVRVSGVLRLVTPMALGDGGVEGGKADGEGGVATFMRTADGRAVIPGSSLKGVLRSQLAARRCEQNLIEELFGRRSLEKVGESTSDPGQGGKVEFGFSYSRAPVPGEEEQSVSIDRVTRAAEEQKLFATRVVPAGTEFDVELLGFDLTRGALAALLAALEDMRPDADPPPTLGSGSANEYGLVQWAAGGVQVLTDEGIRRWLDQPVSADDPWSAAEALQVPDLPKSDAADRAGMRWDLKLCFHSWFLVKDPAKSGRKKGTGQDEADKLPDAFPRLTADGRVLLPVRSFRGALRSQVERIARTLHPDAGGDPQRPTAQRIVECLFGDTGGRATVRCSRFADQRPAWLAEPGAAIPRDVLQRQRTALLRREFVAIDRFTGGAAEHLKFDAVAAWRPVLDGHLAIAGDAFLGQCKRRGVPPAAALGLLVLALRDLCEGDVSFGFGTGKGFGQCAAEIVRVNVSDVSVLAQQLSLDPEKMQQQIEQERASGTRLGPLGGLPPEIRAILAMAVAEVQRYLCPSAGGKS